MTILPGLSTFCLGVATAWIAWTVIRIISGPRPIKEHWSALELERRARIRAGDATYARFEPLVNELGAVNSSFLDTQQREQFERELRLSDEELPWTPEEYIACRQLDGLFAALVVGAIAGLFGGVLLACIVGVAILFFYVFNSYQSIKKAAVQRSTTIKRRLPFAVDLAALMLEAGASFMDALRTVVRENNGHPLGTELARVLQNIEMGRPRSQALYAFQERLEDQDVTDLVVAINKGEELGTPLSTIMRNQADQMRLKRSQWGETAAAEAEVRMTFPSMVVTIACMLLILAPFALSLLRNGF